MTSDDTTTDDPLATDSTDDEDEYPGRAYRAGEAIGNGLAMPFVVTGRVCKVAGRTFFTGLTRRIPFVGSSFWQGMIKWSTYQYQQAAGADVVNFSAEPHGIEPRAANYHEADPDKPEYEPGWVEAGGEKTWGAGSEGRDVERMGKADIILTDRAAHETATPLQLRYAEALDLEQVQGLIAGATVEQPIIEMWPQDPEEMSAGDGGHGSAVADGGTPGFVDRRRGQTTVHATDAGLADAVVDLASDFGDGKGMRVSARKYKDQELGRTDPEEMQKQETRGFLAGMAGQDQDKIFKIAVIALLVVLLVALGPYIIGALFGSGGGGVSLPIMLGP